ncbi:MAG: sugar ABC transporter ATP-binding protein [Planctomycetota bacterium]
MSTPLASLSSICKSFGSHRVLNCVDLELLPNQVHWLAGENGAGKSTLIKVLGGIHKPDSGEITVAGQQVKFQSPQDATAAGIAVIHQELSVIPSMTVEDNLLLGRQPTTFGFIRTGGARASVMEMLNRLRLAVSPDEMVEKLSMASRQRLEIAKALSLDSKIIVMDEPTSSLSAPEVDDLFELIAELKSDGCAILYVSHKMEELERIADTVTVLRDGVVAGSGASVNVSKSRLVQWMVGREVDEQFPERTCKPGECRLRVKIATSKASESNAITELNVAAGEVLGIGGVEGCGATELLMAIFGADSSFGDLELQVDGNPVAIRSPRDAIAHGLALVTNDRRGNGLVLDLSCRENVVMAVRDRLCHGPIRQLASEVNVSDQFSKQLQVRAASLDLPVAALSGGNQQKIVLAKWLATGPKVLLLDEPTRGVDVGAKQEIYSLINRWTDDGLAIVMVSTEMPELLAMSDRIMVMRDAKFSAEFRTEEATAEAVLWAAISDDPSSNHGEASQSGLAGAVQV